MRGELRANEAARASPLKSLRDLEVRSQKSGVAGTHLGLPFNATVFGHIADRLAAPRGARAKNAGCGRECPPHVAYPAYAVFVCSGGAAVRVAWGAALFLATGFPDLILAGPTFA